MDNTQYLNELIDAEVNACAESKHKKDLWSRLTPRNNQKDACRAEVMVKYQDRLQAAAAAEQKIQDQLNNQVFTTMNADTSKYVTIGLIIISLIILYIIFS